MKSFKYITLASLLISSNVLAKSYDVKALWNLLEVNSAEIQSVNKSNETSKLELKRYKRHWLPKLQLQASQFQTNDPGGVFFNNLGQGAIEQADFNPSSLNKPDNETFRNTSLKLTLPLYEGGMKAQRVKLGKKMYASSNVMVQATKTKVFKELVEKYGNVLVLRKSNNQLNDLNDKITKLLSRYETGRKSNLVGYSGLLGLQGVQNRVQGLLEQKNASQSHAKSWIQTMSGVEKNFTLKAMSISTLIEKQFTKKLNNKNSTYLKSKELQVQALEHMPKMERARFLPQVGLFANKSYYHGDRDDNDSTSIGVYLGWDLFNNDSYGRVAEAKSKLLAAKAQIRSGKDQEFVAQEALNSALKALKRNIDITKKSTTLLNEQTSVALRLFKSGKLTALQLAEVLNRRVDLIEQREKVNLEYLKINGQIYQLNN